MCGVGENNNPRKRMKFLRESSFKEVILKSYGQQRSSRAPVQAVELTLTSLNDQIIEHSEQMKDGSCASAKVSYMNI